MTKEEGAGKWWEGYDPQELYAQNHAHSQNWSDWGTIHSQWGWGNGVCPPSVAYMQKFQNRVLQCINAYNPDMIYFDDTVLPFYGASTNKNDQYSLNILKHYYYHSAAQHDGVPQVVVTGKILEDRHKQAMLAQASNNTGKPNAMKVAAFMQQINTAKDVLATSPGEEEQAAAVTRLHSAYNVLKQTGFNPAGTPDEVGHTDVTLDYLTERSNFAATEMGSHFGKPVNWTVENYKIPAGGDGTRNGLDRYPGYDCLSLGVWDDRQNNTDGDLSQARIYRKVDLAAGSYYFGAAYEANYQLAQAYIFAATDIIPQTSDIPAQSIAYDDIAKAGKDNATFRGIYFELDQPQQVLLGFQADLASGASQQEFRASKVTLINYGTATGILEKTINGKSLDRTRYARTSEKGIYNLQGRNIDNSPQIKKGIYVVNNKKVYIQ